MITRREFLRSLGIAGLVAATPKFIIDLAANTYKKETWYSIEKVWNLNPAYKEAPFEEIVWFGDQFCPDNVKQMLTGLTRRFEVKDGLLVPVLKFIEV